MQPQDLFCNRSCSCSALRPIEAVSGADISAHLTVKCECKMVTNLYGLNPEGPASELDYSVCYRGDIYMFNIIIQVRDSQKF